jgi:voltage-dependent calcium channel T type alpha-1G
LDLSLTIIFIMEAILKMIAYGLIFCGSTSYLRSSWNALDLIIVIISVTSLMLPTTNLNSIKVIRLMKILRPLRVISRNEGLKISIRTLGVAVPGIINVILVTCLFLYICGIIGVNYFKGRLNECVGVVDVMGPRIMELLNSVDDKWGCINSGGEWVRDFLNFDDVFNAMRTFFIVSTSVQWSDIMYRVCGIRGYDLTISDNIEMPIAALFFVVVVVIGNFFLMNLFVGVIISTYNREKELAGKDYMKSDDQKSTENTHLMFLNTKPQHKMKIP